MQLTLPVADADQQRDRPKEVVVAVAADGRYAVNRTGLEGKSVDVLAAALQARHKAGPAASSSSAPTRRPHQSVVTVMEAARRVGLTQITFATQSSASAGAGKP